MGCKMGAIKIPAELMEAPEWRQLSVGAKAAYMALLRYEHDGRVIMSQQEIGQGINVSPCTARGYMRELVYRGLIRRVKPTKIKRGKIHAYAII